MKVIKKDKTMQAWDDNKIKNACKKSAERVMKTFSDDELDGICKKISTIAKGLGDEIDIETIHHLVEAVLDFDYPEVAKSYREYRNYKTDFVKMLDDVYKAEQQMMYQGDVSNANSDSSMIPTQRSLTAGYLSKEFYKKFFLSQDERQAINDGYIYIHDMKDRRYTFNCCLFDADNVMKNGFEMGNLWYNRPKTIDVAFDVLSDIMMTAGACQYGGETAPEIDKILAPYAEASYNKYKQKYLSLGVSEDLATKQAMADTERDVEQGVQAWEYRFNSVGSSRGDYVFVAVSFGLGTSEFEQMISRQFLRVRAKGQGKDGFKKPVLFPKLTFLYDEALHGDGGVLANLFDEAIQCSSRSMYPDFLSLSGEGYIPDIYRRYGKAISLMG